MSLSDLASLGSFVSGAAVLVSLIFLYFQVRQVNHQIKQAEKNLQSTARLQRASIAVAANSNVSTTPSLVEALHKVFTGAKDISAEQLLQVRIHYRTVFQTHQEAFLQHREGLIPDGDFGMTIDAIVLHFRLAAGRLIWKQTRSNLAPDFVEFMDAILERTAVRPYVIDPSEWLRDWAREAAGTEQSGLSEPVAALKLS